MSAKHFGPLADERFGRGGYATGDLGQLPPLELSEQEAFEERSGLERLVSG